jgi:hypothetical protein
MITNHPIHIVLQLDEAKLEFISPNQIGKPQCCDYN